MDDGTMTWFVNNNARVWGNFKKDEAENMKSIPHGSGIDNAWNCFKKKGYFKLSNSFHTMNAHGMYIGYADFSVIIPFKDPIDFNLHFLLFSA